MQLKDRWREQAHSAEQRDHLHTQKQAVNALEVASADSV